MTPPRGAAPRPTPAVSRCATLRPALGLGVLAAALLRAPSAHAYDESGVKIRQRTWTSAANYLYEDFVKLQLDWLVRRHEDPLVPNLPDNALILSLQGKI